MVLCHFNFIFKSKDGTQVLQESSCKVKINKATPIQLVINSVRYGHSDGQTLFEEKIHFYKDNLVNLIIIEFDIHNIEYRGCTLQFLINFLYYSTQFE